MYLKLHNISAIILMAVFPLFFFWGPDYLNTRSLQELWNNGHVFFFLFLSLYIYHHRAITNINNCCPLIVCAIVCVALGGSIELLQYHLPGRTFSVPDFVRDISGFMIAFFLVIIKDVKEKIVMMVSILSVSAILAANFFSLFIVLKDEIFAANEFPVLAGFERKGELGRWETNGVQLDRVTSPVRVGHYALKIDFSTARYSGLSLVHFLGDWRGYDFLLFSAFNPGKPLRLHFRVHDALHKENQEYGNRYNSSVLLAAGWNDIRISMYDILKGPQKREMDIAAIQGIGIFVMDQKVTRTLYLDSVHLE